MSDQRAVEPRGEPAPIRVAVQSVTKAFPAVLALDEVDFDLRSGEVHALLGENGAGKSTLIKIISGVFPPDSGTVVVGGVTVRSFAPVVARRLGVGTVYQGLSLVPQLSVLQNLFLGHEELAVPSLGWLDLGSMRQRAVEVLQEVGLDVRVDVPVEALSASQQQLVEIAKILLLGAQILILDEPTDKLTAHEADRLFNLIRSIRAAGRGIIYITHKLEEVGQIADRVTVLRDGRRVGTLPASEASVSRLIQMMVGRELKDMFPKVDVPPGEEVLRVEGLTSAGAVHDVSFGVRAGEIVGIAGLVGSGRTELAKAIVGALPVSRGRIYLHGKAVRVTSPRAAVRMGIALLPEDRQRDGLFAQLSVRDNIVLPSLRGTWLRFGEMGRISRQYVERLRIRASSIDAPLNQLSGGNQQKVVLAKWLASRSRVFIFDEPTQGIDVGSKVEIYRLIGTLVQDGAAIILISSELREVLGLADRILVMRKGRLAAEFRRSEANQRRVLSAIFGEAI